MMKNNQTQQEMIQSTIQTLRKWSFNIGASLIIFGLAFHYGCRFLKYYTPYLNDLSNKLNSDIFFYLLSAGLSLSFASNMKNENSFKSLISGNGAIVFAYVFIIYMGDFVFRDWFNRKSIYIFIGILTLCIIYSLYRHLKLRRLSR